MKKKKIGQRYLKAENLNSPFFFLANSWHHLSGLAGTLYKALRLPRVESFSGLCLALSKAGPHLSLLYREDDMHQAEKLPSESEKGTRLLLRSCGIIWNVLQMAATLTTKKVITKCVHHNMLLKTLCIVLTFP